MRKPLTTLRVIEEPKWLFDPSERVKTKETVIRRKFGFRIGKIFFGFLIFGESKIKSERFEVM